MVAEPAPGAELSAPAAAVVDFTDARLRLAAARVAWQRALALTETAVVAAGAAGTTDWATAELSLSRLERYGAEFREIADALGKVMTSPERNALILEATAAYDEHVARFNALRLRLAR